MNADRMDKLDLELKIIDDRLAFFITVNGKQVQDEYNTSVMAFFAHFNVDTSLQKQECNGRYYTESGFYPLNCSCGVAGCNGFHDGIYQKNKKYSVEWRVNPEYYGKHLPKQHYSFWVNNYRRSVLHCWWWLVEALDKPAEDNPDSLECIREIMERMQYWHPKQYAQLMASRKEYEHYLRVEAFMMDVRRNHR